MCSRHSINCVMSYIFTVTAIPSRRSPGGSTTDVAVLPLRSATSSHNVLPRATHSLTKLHCEAVVVVTSALNATLLCLILDFIGRCLGSCGDRFVGPTESELCNQFASADVFRVLSLDMPFTLYRRARLHAKSM
jgi:hypothetical protein